MKKNPAAAAERPNDEIAALVKRLQTTKRRLMELTGAEMDTVLLPGGQPYLFPRTEEGPGLQRIEAQPPVMEAQMAILNALPTHIALVDSQGVIVFINEAWRRFGTLNGLRDPEFGVGRNYVEVCEGAIGDRSEEAQDAAAGIRRVLRGEAKDFAIEYPCHTLTEKHWFRLIVTPAREDRRAGAVIMHFNITERKLAEEALRSSEGNMAAAQRIAHLGSWELELTDSNDIDANPLYWSDEMFRIAGYEPSAVEVSNDLFFRLIPKDEHEPFRQMIRAAIRDRRQYSIVHRLVRSNGAERIVHAVAQLVFDEKSGQPLKVLGTAHDITDQKRSEARFRRLVDSNVQGVLFWNAKGEITEANDAFLQLVRYTREDLDTGRISWAAITPPEYAHGHRRGLETITAKGASAPYEKEFIRKDGTRVPILLGAAAFEDNLDEGVCFVLDLTERKKLEQQFLRAQRIESIGTLAGGIAHDLNNILTPIMMSIDVLKLTATDPQAKSILATIETSSKRGADIVRQVLSFARGMEGERIEVQPNSVLKELENIVRDTFPKDIRLHFSVPDETWMILGDPTQVHQVLLNLCVNARDAMPVGGSLSVNVANWVIDQRYAAMNLQFKAGRYIRINVTDSGVGIPPDLIDKIFEPFFTTKEVNRGTGLGLSTVMAIVKSHGGVINVYSEPGKGTTFNVYLPAIDGSSDVRKKQLQQISLPRGGGETVLVVDDEAAILTITSQTLRAFGYRVLTASDGAEAVAVYAEHRNEIAVVLTDMAMPAMDGPAAIHALMRINPAIRIVAASGLNVNGSVTQMSGIGVKHFLTKPYTAGTLLKAMRAILDEAL